MKKSKNSRVNKGTIARNCKYCGKELDAVYEAKMPVKPNGARAFKLKLVRECCNV